MSGDRLKDIPALSRDAGNLPAVMSAIRETLQTFRGYRGDKLDRALTLRDFESGVLQGLIAGLGGGTVIIGGGGGSGGGDTEPDLTPPPTATGLIVTAGISNLFFQHDQPVYTQGHGHAKTIVYGAKWARDDPTVPTFTESVVLMEFEGTFNAYPSDPATRWVIWIKWKSNDGVLSVDPSAPAQATTGQDVRLLLDALTGQITRSQLFADLGAPIDSILPAQDEAGAGILAAAVATHAEATARAQALTDEALARGTAITDVRQVLTTGDAQLASQIITLSAVVGGNSAALQQEATTRANADSAEVLLRSTLAAEVRDPTTGLVATRATLINDYSTIASRDTAIATASTNLTSAFTAADATTLAGAQSYTYSRSAIDGAFTSQFNAITANYQAADNAVATNAAADVRSYSYAKSTVDSAIASSVSTLTTNYTNADTASAAGAVSAANAYTGSYTYARSTIDGAFSSQFNTLTANYQGADTAAAAGAVSTANAYTNSYTYSTAGVNGAISGAITTYSATVNGQIAAAVQTETTARANADGSLFAQYTVKLDTNGYVSGFGLASTTSGATPFSSFVIRADSFAIASPSGPGIAPAVPFIVRTTAGNVNGVPYPAGVYIDAAYILDLTAPIARLGSAWIDDGKVANLSAAKLTAGDGTIGGNLKSGNFASGAAGWLLTPAGYFEASNAVIRGATYTGTIYANAGLIGGVVIGANGIYSSNFVAGTSGFRISSNGSVEISNLYARGDIQATSLNAATGTFTGQLSAATGIFSGSLSAATGTFAGSLSAASGTFAGTLTANAVNAVNSINIAGNSVSSSAFAAGSAGTVSTTLNVPAGQAMRVYAHATSAGAEEVPPSPYTLTVSVNGASVSTIGIYALYGTTGNEDGTQSSTYAQASASIAMVSLVNGPATVTASAATGDGRYKTISAFGLMK